MDTFLWITCFLFLCGFAYGYPSGAGDEACEHMTPLHAGFPVQTSPSPYVLRVRGRRTYSNNSYVVVTLERSTRSDDSAGEKFRGILLQARSTINDAVVGQWMSWSGRYQHANCSEPFSSLTHKDRTVKLLTDGPVSFVWIAPSIDVGIVFFRATVVQDFVTFWRIGHAVVQFSTSMSDDINPPVILNCPVRNITAQATGDFASVQLPELRVIDDSREEPMLAIGPPSNSGFLPLGQHPIRYVYKDAAENEATCEYYVIVTSEDTTPPMISGCPSSPIFKYVKLGRRAARLEYTEPTATDPSSPVTVVRNRNPDSFFSFGGTTVTYVFADSLDNEATCTFLIVVLNDETPPVITGCPTAPIFNTIPADELPLVVVWTPPNATDNSNGPVNITIVGGNIGDAFPEGQSIVTYQFTDQFSNLAECNIIIILTIGANTNPVIGPCPDNVQIEQAGGTSVRLSYNPPTCSDTDDSNPTVTCDPPATQLLDSFNGLITCTCSDNVGASDTVVCNEIDDSSSGSNVVILIVIAVVVVIIVGVVGFILGRCVKCRRCRKDEPSDDPAQFDNQAFTGPSSDAAPQDTSSTPPAALGPHPNQETRQIYSSSTYYEIPVGSPSSQDQPAVTSAYDM